MRRSASLLLVLAALLAACSYQPFIGGDPSVPPSVNPDEPVEHRAGESWPAAERRRVRPRDAQPGRRRRPSDRRSTTTPSVPTVERSSSTTGAAPRPASACRRSTSAPILDGSHRHDRVRGHAPRCGRRCLHHGGAPEVHGRDPWTRPSWSMPPSPTPRPASRSSRPTRRRSTSRSASRTRSRWRSPATTSAATARPSPSTSTAASPSATAWPAPRSTPASSHGRSASARGTSPGAEVCIEIALAKAFVFTLDSQLIRDGSLTG